MAETKLVTRDKTGRGQDWQLTPEGTQLARWLDDHADGLDVESLDAEDAKALLMYHELPVTVQALFGEKPDVANRLHRLYRKATLQASQVPGVQRGTRLIESIESEGQTMNENNSERRGTIQALWPEIMQNINGAQEFQRVFEALKRGEDVMFRTLNGRTCVIRSTGEHDLD